MNNEQQTQEQGTQEAQGMMQMLQQMMAQMSALNSKVEQLEKGQQTPKTETLISEQQPTEPSQEQAQTTTQPQDNKPTKNLGPLAEFTGNRDELEPWIAQAQAKLAVDYTNCTETTKFFMLHNRLRGEAARQLQPWVQASVDTSNMTAQCLLDQLRLSFGDPHVQEKAQRGLHKLRQTNKPFMEYFTEFRKLVLEAGGTHWPDGILKAYLEAGLSQELQRSMIGLGSTSQSFEDYCTELKRVSDQLEAFNLRNGGNRTQQAWQQGWWRGQNKVVSAGSRQPKPMTPQHDNMDWEPTGAAKVAQGRRVKWVDEQEMQKRKEERRCLRCGDATHVIAHCPWLPPRRPTRSAKPVQREYLGPELEDPEEEALIQLSEN